jgi:hypothetical protein
MHDDRTLTFPAMERSPGSRKTASDWLPIEYGGFWDVPRLVLIWVGGRAWILYSPFNEELDEYEDTYAVYLVERPGELPSWLSVIEELEPVARIRVTDIEFDKSRRKAIRRSSLKDLPL